MSQLVKSNATLLALLLLTAALLTELDDKELLLGSITRLEELELATNDELLNTVPVTELDTKELLLAPITRLEELSVLATNDELLSTVADVLLATDEGLDDTAGALELSCGVDELFVPLLLPPPPQAVSAIAAVRLRTRLVCFITIYLYYYFGFFCIPA
ncbi:hypothetical protein B0D95_15035 [Cellvibrio sp. PSBB023]|nr:hypothetical protein B0D95_15035 [Cellvibrio sp. PSBB023]